MAERNASRHLLWHFPTIFTLAALGVQFVVGAFATDRGQTSDEAAHFVTSLMLADYLHHLGKNPIAFAQDYYRHLPRVALGHWPPFFELVQATSFAFFGASNGVVMAVQAIIGGLMAGLPAALIGRRQGIAVGFLTGVVIFANRNILFLLDTDMADNLLGLLVFLSAWAWSAFYTRPSTKTAVAFAAALAAAMLTKGSAVGLIALPPLYLWIKRDMRFLLRRSAILAFAAVLALTVPWYLATYRLAANGWNYSWGTFTLIAVPFYTKGLLHDFSTPVAGFVLGTANAISRPNREGEIDMAAFAMAAILQFLFILVVPADLQLRYLVPVYPCAAMVAVSGLFELIRTISPSRTAAGLASVLVVLSVWWGFGRPHVEFFRTAEALTHIASRRNPLILVSGGARFEGAMIASVGADDRARFFYVLRASKVLSSSSFSGNGYQQRFSRAADLKGWLVQNQIGWIGIDSSGDSMRYAHNRLLWAVMKNDPRYFEPVWQAARSDGVTALFKTPASSAPPRDPRLLLAEQAPSGVR